MKAIAKNDVRVLMEDGRFSKFIEGNIYRCMLRGDGVVLIDENKTGFTCDMDSFKSDFILLNDE